MSTLVHAKFVPKTYWLFPVINAVSSNAALATAWAGWRSHRLADLGFAIETRLGNLIEIVRLFDRSVGKLAKQLQDEPNVGAWAGQAYGFDDQETLHLALVSGSAFVAESRSCFENLAEFNNEFCQYFLRDPAMDKATSYAAISTLAGNPPWVRALRGLRHDIMHHRAPWFALDVVDPLKLEPVLLLEWRQELHAAGDCITLATMKAIHSGLPTAVRALASSLELRVKTMIP
jgi:hypothetical protein